MKQAYHARRDIWFDLLSNKWNVYDLVLVDGRGEYDICYGVASKAQALTWPMPTVIRLRFPYAKHPRASFHMKRATYPVIDALSR